MIRFDKPDQRLETRDMREKKREHASLFGTEFGSEAFTEKPQVRARGAPVRTATGLAFEAQTGDGRLQLSCSSQNFRVPVPKLDLHGSFAFPNKG